MTTEDVHALASPVLRHRIVVNFAAESEGVTPDKVVERMIAETPLKGKRPEPRPQVQEHVRRVIRRVRIGAHSDRHTNNPEG